MLLFLVVFHLLLFFCFWCLANSFWIFLNFFTGCELLYFSWIISELLLNLISNKTTSGQKPKFFFKKKIISFLYYSIVITFFSDFFLFLIFFFKPFTLFLCTLITLILIALNVSAFTLLDRKVIAVIQRRRGPNVVGYWGLLQGIIDAIKLIFKEIIYPSEAGIQFFLFAPIMTLSVSLLGWGVVCLHPVLCFSNLSFDLLVVFLISSINIYSIILAGWASNSRYAFLGGLRAIAQVISYELPMIFCLLPIICVCSSLNLKVIIFSQTNFFFFIPFFPCALIFLLCIFAETNRSPFDLPEAESELVAGYNTEYSSVIFAFFFLAEYSNILLMSVVWVSIFLGGWLPFSFLFNMLPYCLNFCIKLCLVCFFFVVVRANLPRFRYDQFMNFGWKVLLPISFVLFIFYLSYLTLFYSLAPLSIISFIYSLSL